MNSINMLATINKYLLINKFDSEISLYGESVLIEIIDQKNGQTIIMATGEDLEDTYCKLFTELCNNVRMTRGVTFEGLSQLWLFWKYLYLHF